MFFTNYFNGVAETLNIKYLSHRRDGINSADIGELCELFIKEFLIDCLDDHYRIFRGGNIVNMNGDSSPQLDIVITNRNGIKVFGDKGIYPIETVTSVFSITSNLTLSKLKIEIISIGKIPKHNYDFSIEKLYGQEFRDKTHEVFKKLIPYTCIFGFKGDISNNWIEEINEEIIKVSDSSLWPSIIIVNKRGMIEKLMNPVTKKFDYSYTAFDDKEKAGECFSKIVFHLYTLSGEQTYMRPKYENYFNNDF